MDSFEVFFLRLFKIIFLTKTYLTFLHKFFCCINCNNIDSTTAVFFAVVTNTSFLQTPGILKINDYK